MLSENYPSNHVNQHYYFNFTKTKNEKNLTNQTKTKKTDSGKAIGFDL